jgi:glutathione S-transferase
VLYIAERSEALMPLDSAGRTRTKAWMFAALSSIERIASAAKPDRRSRRLWPHSWPRLRRMCHAGKVNRDISRGSTAREACSPPRSYLA